MMRFCLLHCTVGVLLTSHETRSKQLPSPLFRTRHLQKNKNSEQKGPFIFRQLLPQHAIGSFEQLYGLTKSEVSDGPLFLTWKNWITLKIQAQHYSCTPIHKSKRLDQLGDLTSLQSRLAPTSAVKRSKLHVWYTTPPTGQSGLKMKTSPMRTNSS